MTLPICIIPAHLEETYRGNWKDFDKLLEKGVVAVASGTVQGQPHYEIARAKYERIKGSEGVKKLHETGLMKVVEEAIA